MQITSTKKIFFSDVKDIFKSFICENLKEH